MKLNKVRKEDDLYFHGAFWIIGESIKDILRSKFELLCDKQVCDYADTLQYTSKSKSSLSHKNLWKIDIKRNQTCRMIIIHEVEQQFTRELHSFTFIR